MSTPGAFNPEVTSAIAKAKYLSADAVLSSATYDGMLMPQGLAANIVNSLSKTAYVPEESSDTELSPSLGNTSQTHAHNPFLADMLPTAYLAALQSPVHQSFDQHAALVKPSYFGESRSIFTKPSLPPTLNSTKNGPSSPSVATPTPFSARSGPLRHSASVSASSASFSSLTSPRAGDPHAASTPSHATRTALASQVRNIPPPLPVPSPAELPSLLLPPLVTTNPYLYLASTFTTATMGVVAPHRHTSGRKKTARSTVAAGNTATAGTNNPENQLPRNESGRSANSGANSSGNAAPTSTETKQSLRDKALVIKTPLPPTYVSDVAPDELLPPSAKHPLPLPLPPILSSCRPPKHFDPETRTLLTIIPKESRDNATGKWTSTDKSKSMLPLSGPLATLSRISEDNSEVVLPSDDSLTGGFSKELFPVTLQPPVAVLDDSYAVVNKVKKSRQLEDGISSGRVSLRDLDERWLVPWGVSDEVDDVRTRADKARIRQEIQKQSVAKMRMFCDSKSVRGKESNAVAAGKMNGNALDSAKNSGVNVPRLRMGAVTDNFSSVTAVKNSPEAQSIDEDDWEDDDNDEDNVDNPDDSDDMSASDDDNLTEYRAEARIHRAIANVTHNQFRVREFGKDQHKPLETHAFSATFGAAPARPSPKTPLGDSLATVAGTVQPLQSQNDATREWIRPLPDRGQQNNSWLPPPPLPPLPPSIFPALPPPAATNTPFQSSTASAAATVSTTSSCVTLPRSRCLVDYAAATTATGHGPGAWDSVHYSHRGLLKREVLTEAQRRRGPGAYDIAKAADAMQPHVGNAWTATNTGNGFRAMAHNFDSTMHHYSNPEMNANNNVVLVNVKVNDSGQLVQRGGGEADMSSARTISVMKQTTPGPGTYRSHTTIDPKVWSTGTNSANPFTIGQRHPDVPIEVTPGPGQYARDEETFKALATTNRQIATLLVPSYRKYQHSVEWVQKRSKTQGKALRKKEEALKSGKVQRQPSTAGKSLEKPKLDSSKPKDKALSHRETTTRKKVGKKTGKGVEPIPSIPPNTDTLLSSVDMALGNEDIGSPVPVVAGESANNQMATESIEQDLAKPANDNPGDAQPVSAEPELSRKKTTPAEVYHNADYVNEFDSEAITVENIFRSTSVDVETTESAEPVNKAEETTTAPTTTTDVDKTDENPSVHILEANDTDDEQPQADVGTRVTMRVRDADEDKVHVVVTDGVTQHERMDETDATHTAVESGVRAVSPDGKISTGISGSASIPVPTSDVATAKTPSQTADDKLSIPSDTPQDAIKPADQLILHENLTTHAATATPTAPAAPGMTTSSSAALLAAFAANTAHIVANAPTPGVVSRKKGTHAAAKLRDEEIFPWIVAGAHAALELKAKKENDAIAEAEAEKAHKRKTDRRTGHEHHRASPTKTRHHNETAPIVSNDSNLLTSSTTQSLVDVAEDDDTPDLSRGLFEPSAAKHTVPTTSAPTPVSASPLKSRDDENDEATDMLADLEEKYEEEPGDEDEEWDYAAWENSPFSSASSSRNNISQTSSSNSLPTSRPATTSQQGSRRRGSFSQIRTQGGFPHLSRKPSLLSHSSSSEMQAVQRAGQGNLSMRASRAHSRAQSRLPVANDEAKVAIMQRTSHFSVAPTPQTSQRLDMDPKTIKRNSSQYALRSVRTSRTSSATAADIDIASRSGSVLQRNESRSLTAPKTGSKDGDVVNSPILDEDEALLSANARSTLAMQRQSQRYAAAIEALPRLQVSAHSDTTALMKALADKSVSASMSDEALLMVSESSDDRKTHDGKTEPINLFSSVQSRVGKTGLKETIGTHHEDLGKARKQAALELLGPSILEAGGNGFVLEKYEDITEKRLYEQQVREEKRKSPREMPKVYSLNIGSSTIPVNANALQKLGVSVQM